MSRYRCGVTVATACPCWSSNAVTSSPNWARRRDSISGGGRGRRELATPLLPDVLAGDLLLQLHDAVEQGLGPGGAPGHVDVDRDDLVDPLRDGVAVPVGAAAVGARAERDDVLGLGHWIADTLHGRGRLVCERA